MFFPSCSLSFPLSFLLLCVHPDSFLPLLPSFPSLNFSCLFPPLPPSLVSLLPFTSSFPSNMAQPWYPRLPSVSRRHMSRTPTRRWKGDNGLVCGGWRGCLVATVDPRISDSMAPLEAQLVKSSEEISMPAISRDP